MATLTCYCSFPSLPIPKPTSKSSLSFLHNIPNPQFFTKYSSFLSIKYQKWTHRRPIILQCSNFNTASSFTLSESDLEPEPEPETEEEEEEEEEGEGEGEGDDDGEEEEDGDGVASIAESSVKRKRKRKRRRYRKQYPGEKIGITEEMRFVAMKFRNSKGKKIPESDDDMKDSDAFDSVSSDEDDIGGGGGGEETWEPSMEGFIKYLVDSKLVFSTIERIVDESSDVSYAYFRRTGLERAECISKDLKWFSQQGHVIPEPSDPGVTYANYLEELAEKTPRLFLSHFYNINFSHIAGGQVIAKKAFERLLEEKELEFYKWEGDEEKLLRSVRENFNMLAKHWSRDDKNKCLREVTKAFRFMGQIVRLIIL